MPRVPCSLYPLPSQPPHVLLRVAPDPWTWLDQALLGSCSLALIGSWIWVPTCYAWAYRRWKNISKDDRRKKALYGALLLAVTALFVAGPHRSPKIGNKLKWKKWSVWQLWTRFVAMEVWHDIGSGSKGPEKAHAHAQKAAHDEYLNTTNITAMVPHGIFPFSVGLAGIPHLATEAFGNLRVAIATATNLFPLVRDVASLAEMISVSREAVSSALRQGHRVAIVPGGIPEMFEGYPRPLTHPDDEFAIVPRGFCRMAIQQQVPILPVYCFGATKLFKRVRLWEWLEELCLRLRIGLCLFYGEGGVPIPLRTRTFYILGNAIRPSTSLQQSASSSSLHQQSSPQQDEDAMTQEVHQQFCEELMRMFENNKELYGWGHKVLHLVKR